MEDLPGTELENLRSGFCLRCRNAKCQHAKFGSSIWLKRVSTQEDKLFNPNVADQDDPRFEKVRNMGIVDMHGREIKVRQTPTPQEWPTSHQGVKEGLPQPTKVPPKQLSTNTPVPIGGILIENDKWASDGSRTDPWSPPVTTGDPNARKVKPGAVIKLGGGGGQSGDKK